MNLGDAIRPGCGLLPADVYLSREFYDLTLTWDQTIGDSTCVIIKDRQDMDWLRTVNPAWHQSLTGAGVRSIVLFPLPFRPISPTASPLATSKLTSSRAQNSL